MSKFHGVIGYSVSVETAPDVWEQQIIEKECGGDLLSTYNSWSNGNGVNDNFTLNTRFSIVANSFMLNNLYAMKYLIYRNTKWRISSADDSQPPRVIITIGGVYNENEN